MNGPFWRVVAGYDCFSTQYLESEVLCLTPDELAINLTAASRFVARETGQECLAFSYIQWPRLDGTRVDELRCFQGVVTLVDWAPVAFVLCDAIVYYVVPDEEKFLVAKYQFVLEYDLDSFLRFGVHGQFTNSRLFFLDSLFAYSIIQMLNQMPQKASSY